jgi:hypothetical protein
VPPSWKLWGGLGAVVLVFALYLGWRNYERRIGKLELETASLNKENANLRGVIASDSVALAKRDTVKLFARIDTGHTIIQRLIDTAVVHHTDTVKVTVERLVTIDSTLKACRDTARDCAKLATDRGRRIAVLDSLVGVLKASQPGFLSKYGGRAVWGIVGAGVGYLAHSR